jgi:hypothetical protein
VYVFNKVVMDAASLTVATAKLSSAKPIGFRPGPLLSGKIAALQEEVARRGGSISATDIIRDGLLGCWPQVHAHLLVRHTTVPAQADAVARILAHASKAMELGVTPDQIEAQLELLLERKLTTATR